MHGRFELWTGGCPDAETKGKVLSGGMWQQKTGVSRTKVLHFGKEVPSHRMG